MAGKQVMELQPTWTEMTDTALKGTVMTYPEYLDPAGVTYQFPTEMTILFERAGITPDCCSGMLVMQAVDRPGDATSKVVMLYGNVGGRLELRATGFDTEACDAIFQSAGGLTWGEVFAAAPAPDKKNL